MDETLAMELSAGPWLRKSIATICAEVASDHGITVADIRSRYRDRYIIPARQRFFSIARDYGHSTPKIGRWCGGRDHTTVMYGSEQHEARAAGLPAPTRARAAGPMQRPYSATPEAPAGVRV